MNTLKIPFSEIKCIIFDFDGVILDSSEIKTACFEKFYRQYDTIFEPAMAYHYEKKGMSRLLQFEYVAKELMRVKDPDKMVKDMLKRFTLLVREEVSKALFIPGAVDLLKFLYKVYPLFIVSSAPHEELEEAVISRDIKKYFIDYYGSVNDKADYIDKILAEKGIAKHHVLYVGDTLKDLSAAQKANVYFCAVQNRLVDFSNHNCTKVFDLKELHDLFSSI